MRLYNYVCTYMFIYFNSIYCFNLTNLWFIQSQDNKTDAQKVEELKQETKALRKINDDLNEQLKQQQSSNIKLVVSNAELKETIKIASDETQVSATGVGENDEASKKVTHLKAMYMQQVTKTLEVQEDLDEFKKKIEKYKKEKIQLVEKIQEKDSELHEFRAHTVTPQHPPTARSFSFDEEMPEDADPAVYVGELKSTLKDRQEQIDSLVEQVKSFETIASQHKQLQQNSKVQSTVVLNQKRKIKIAEVCIMHVPNMSIHA